MNGLVDTRLRRSTAQRGAGAFGGRYTLVPLAQLALVVLLGGLLATACPGTPGEDEADGNLADGGSYPWDPIPDGDYDGGFLDPGWPEAPPCDEPIQQLPNNLESVSIWEPYLTYTKYHTYNDGDLTGFGSDVYLYDLERCQETRLTYRQGEQGGGFIWDGELLFHDYPDSPYSSQWSVASALVSFDTITQQFTYLDAGSAARFPVHHGRYVMLFSASPVCCDGYVLSLRLWDRQSDSYHGLGDGDDYPGAVISAHTGAWRVGDYWPTDNTHIEYMDLQRGDSTTLASSLLAPNTGPALSGDWLLWSDERNGTSNMYAKHLPTGDEQPLTDDGSNHKFPSTAGSIVCWSTDRYAGDQEGYWDLLLHDLETGVERRLTPESRTSWQMGIVHRQWVVFKRHQDGYDSPREWTVQHLPSTGFMNAAGRLIAE